METAHHVEGESPPANTFFSRVMQGLKYQRVKQLGEDSPHDIEKSMNAIQSEYLSLANIWSRIVGFFEDIDFIEFASIPREEKTMTREADDDKVAGKAMKWVGIITSVGLLVATTELNFVSPLVILIGGGAIIWLLARGMKEVVAVIVRAYPKNPRALETLRIWVIIFWSVAASALVTIGFLRFAVDFGWTNIYLVAAIVGLECSVFTLSGVFEARAGMLDWSRFLTNQYNALRLKRDDMVKKMVTRERYEQEFRSLQMQSAEKGGQ